MRVIFLTYASGDRRRKRLLSSQAFSPKLETGRVSARRLASPEIQGAARGRNLWARERVKAHTKRCREHITRQSFQRATHRRDSTPDDSFLDGDELLSDTEKLLIGELSVDTSLIGSGSTPKSSPASFSDVSIMMLLSAIHCVQKMLQFTQNFQFMFVRN